MDFSSFSFMAGDRGAWKISSMAPLIGENLEPTPFFDVRSGYVMKPPVDFHWLLHGFSGSHRKLRMEEDASRITYFHGQERLGAKCAAFIPVRKKQEWWDLDEEERCAIRDESGISPSGVPPFVRKLHFSRDLGEPFDFLSWYEFQPEDSCRFEKFVESMRNTEEWKYVEREVDLRLLRVDR